MKNFLDLMKRNRSQIARGSERVLKSASFGVIKSLFHIECGRRMTGTAQKAMIPILIFIFSIAFTANPVGAANIMVSTWNWGGSDIYQVDSVTGNATLIGPAGVNLHGLTYIGDTLYGFGDDAADGWIYDGNIYTINEVTGAATLVSTSGFGQEGAIAYNPADGYAYTVGNYDLVQWNLSTGAATFLGVLTENLDISGLAFVGETLFGIGTMFDSLYTIDINSVNATAVGSLSVDIGFSETGFGAGGVSVAGLTYDGSQLLMVTRAGETPESPGGGVYTIDPETGQATLNSLFSENLRNTDIGGVAFKPVNLANPAPVPEPATMLLLGSGLVGFVGFRRKFKK